MRLLAAASAVLALFLLPVPRDGRWTVLFDAVVGGVRAELPGVVSGGCVALVTVGAVQALWKGPGLDPMAWLRVLGLPLAWMMALELGPEVLLAQRGLMWSTLTASVALIVPVGAAALAVLVEVGTLEVVGAALAPWMRPLFRLPGRAALDDLTSWLGSYSVGLYLTRSLLRSGHYTRREAFLIATGFSTVSIGFVGVVCSTLELLHRFPLVLASYFVVVHGLAALQARVGPALGVPDALLAGAEVPAGSEETGGWRAGWARGLARSATAPPLWRVALTGAWDGLVLCAQLLGTLLVVGTAAVLVAAHTPLFTWLGAPLVPVLSALGLPDAAVLAPATLAGITEMYLPALLARDAAVEGRFFIAVLSISQLVFFSSVGPMMLELFAEVPIRVRDLLVLFALRTVVLIPVLAGWTHLVVSLGWL